MIRPRLSTVRAFGALVRFAFLRHLRVSQLGWASLGILGMVALMIGAVSLGPVHWRLELRSRWVVDPRYVPADPKPSVSNAVPTAAKLPDNKPNEMYRKMTYIEYGQDRLPYYMIIPGPPDAMNAKLIAFAPYWSMINVDQSDQEKRKYLDDWAFLNYSRWAVLVSFLTFVLPMFTLAFASGAFGAEREGRTLIWITQRPLPRWAMYLAKFLATLPWIFLMSLIGYATVCIAGGEPGRRAFAVYWQPMVAATLAFGALFHLLGSVTRWPSIVGIAYIFFFELLVANLPGSLKQLSINYYVRSLFYDAAVKTVPTVKPDSLDVYSPASPESAWLILGLITVGLTGVGMYLFGRHETKPEA